MAAKWSDIAQSEDFQALPEVERQRVRADFFDRVIRPEAGDQAAAVRDDFFTATEADVFGRREAPNTEEATGLQVPARSYPGGGAQQRAVEDQREAQRQQARDTLGQGLAIDDDALSVAEDVTQADDEIEASDFGLEGLEGGVRGVGGVGGGAGDLLSMGGEQVDRGLRRLGLGEVLEAGDAALGGQAPSDLFQRFEEWMTQGAEEIDAQQSQAFKETVEASMPQGDLTQPRTWSLGEDPSVTGYMGLMAGLLGEFAPQAATLMAGSPQRAMAAMTAVGGLQAGGSQAREAEEYVESLDHDQLREEAGLYRELVDGGMPPEEAKRQTAQTAGAAASTAGMLLGGAGGAAMGYVLGPLQKRLGGNIVKRVAQSAGIEGAVEGGQEAGETMAARGLSNQAIDAARDVTEGTFGDAVLGGMLGGTIGGLGGVGGAARGDRPQRSQDDIVRERTPEDRAALGEQFEREQARQGDRTARRPRSDADWAEAWREQGLADPYADLPDTEVEIRGQPADADAATTDDPRALGLALDEAPVSDSRRAFLDSVSRLAADLEDGATMPDFDGEGQLTVRKGQADDGSETLRVERDDGEPVFAFQRDGDRWRPVGVSAGQAVSSEAMSAAQQVSGEGETPSLDLEAVDAARQVADDEAPSQVQRLATEQIAVDPETYQFRTEVDESGTDRRLARVQRWDDLRAGNLLVHRREDGRLFAADGHHRIDLAKRLGQPDVNAIVLDEADGWSVEDVRREAALANVAGGNATAVDAAKVFRESDQPPREVVEAESLPDSQLVRDGADLANLSDDAFGNVLNGQLSEKDGAAIGRAFDDPDQQLAAVKAFQEVEPQNENQRALLANELRQAGMADDSGAEQGGLFGDDPAESLLKERVRVMDSLRKSLMRDRRLFATLNRNASEAERAGNRIDRERNQALRDASAQAIELLDRAATTPAINAEINRAAQRLRDGDSLNAVTRDLREVIQNGPQTGSAAAQAEDGRPDDGPGQEPRGDRQGTEGDDARGTGAPEPASPDTDGQAPLDDFDLTTQTEAELAQQDRDRQAADQAEAQRRREDEQRAAADREADDFRLSGSDREADVMAAGGQQDLMGAQPAPDQDTDTPPTDDDLREKHRQEQEQIEADHREFEGDTGVIRSPDTMPDAGRPLASDQRTQRLGGRDVNRYAEWVGRPDLIDQPDSPRLAGVEQTKQNLIDAGLLSATGRLDQDVLSAMAPDTRQHLMDAMERIRQRHAEAEAGGANPNTNRLGLADSAVMRVLDTWQGATTEPEAPAQAPADDTGGESPAIPEPEAPTQPIEDFGEKIEGARKDQHRKLLDSLESDRDIASATLAEVFPQPNYRKLIDEGLAPEAAAFIALARHEIPAKPRKRLRLKRWVDNVATLRHLAQQLISGSWSLDQLRQFAEETGHDLASLFVTAELIAHVEPESLPQAAKWKMEVRTGFTHYRGQDLDPDQTVYALRDDRQRHTGLWSTNLDEIRQQAIAAIADSVGRQKAKGRRRTKISVYSDRHTGDVFLGFKAGRDVVRLKTGFERVKDARAYLDENADALQDRIDALRRGPTMRGESNRERQGPARREGDISPVQFSEAFGFRGVQFGNYVEGKRRQQDLNEAFDALMDLAEVLGVPPRALSLDGSLGLAFGARGKGGRAKAHYEPGQVVINLTKTAGPGSLAHEWFHALDNYLPEGQGSGTFLSNRHSSAVRQALDDAWQGMVRALRDSDFYRQALVFDAPRTKPYWATNIELAARAFERYVHDRLDETGVRNDYLVNIDLESGAYPSDADMAGGIRQAFDTLLATVEAEQTSSGFTLREDGTYDGTASDVPRGQRGDGDQVAAPRGRRRRHAPDQLDLLAPENLPRAPQDADAGQRADAQHAARQQVAGNLSLHYELRPLGEVPVGLSRVTSAADAAHVIAPFRKHGQETMLGVVLDRDDNLLALLRHTKGGKSESSVFVDELVTSATLVPGSAKIWLGHNHPSGSVMPSEADYRVTDRIVEALDASGVEFQGHVIAVAGSREFVHFDHAQAINRDDFQRVTPTPANRRQRVGLQEKVIRRRGQPFTGPITGPRVAKVAMAENLPDTQGVVLLNGHNRPVGVVSMSDAEMAALREDGRARRLMQAIGQANAAGIITVTDGIEAALNVAHFVDNLGGNLRMLDALVKRNERGEPLADFISLAETHHLPVSRGAFLAARDPASEVPSNARPSTEQVHTALAEHAATLGEVTVLDDALAIPTEVLASAADQGVRAENVRGFVHQGRVHVVAGNNGSVDEAIRTALHEAVGHRGIRGVLGSELDTVMQQLYRSLPHSRAGREALSEVRNAYPFLDEGTAEGRVAIGEEMVARLLEKGARPKAWQRAVAKIKELLRRVFPSVPWSTADVLALGEKARDYLRRRTREAAGHPETGVRLAARRVNQSRVSDQFHDLTEDQAEALDMIGPLGVTGTALAKAKEAAHRGMLKLRAGLVDKYAALKELDAQRFGRDFAEIATTQSSWILARMAPAAQGALHTLLENGRIALDPEQKVIDRRDDDSQGLVAVLGQLGDSAEVSRFMGWIAGQRAAKLAEQGRENYFAPRHVEGLKELNSGRTKDGRARRPLYAKVFAEFQQYRDDVLQIADASGLLRKAMREVDAVTAVARQYGAPEGLVERLRKADQAITRADDPEFKEGAEEAYDRAYGELMQWFEGWAADQAEGELFADAREALDAITQEIDDLQRDQRELWSEEFYVPFYRILDENTHDVRGPASTAGLSRQVAYRRLRGADLRIGDLLENTLMNFHHLLSASLKNQAAVQALDNAEALAIARPVPASQADAQSSTFVLRDGQKVWYEIDDPLVHAALVNMTDAGMKALMNSTAMRTMRWFKRVLTNAVTVTLEFVAANTIRDSLQSAAVTPAGMNPLWNAVRGAAYYGNAENRARMIASGGSFQFGHLYGDRPDELRAQLNRNLRSAKVITDPGIARQAVKWSWRRWNESTEFFENINRAKVFQANLDKGKLYAAFQARDLMDFSSHGSWFMTRFLIDTVPFLNARLQGLDKLYRDGMKPALLTAFGRASEGERIKAKRFSIITGALAAASIGLYLHNQDDDDYQELPEWQKDTYWFFKYGDQGFYLPKPFEVGAIATMAERVTQQFTDENAGGELFRDRLWHMVSQTFSFSPVPQAAQPALDLYANRDPFRDRPIEPYWEQQLSPSLRTGPSTTEPARLASEGLESALGDDHALALSPRQIDYLIAGYAGQVGAYAAGIADTLWRNATGQEAPSRRWTETKPVRRFYRDLATPAYATRYQTLFYDGLEEANRVYRDIKRLEELGRLAEARERATTKRDWLRLRKPLNRARRELSDINERMDQVRRSEEMDGDRKRRELELLRAARNRITQALGEEVEQLRRQR